MLYDSLANENSSGEFEKTLGKINAIDYTASIIAALSGGIMAAIFGMNLNYYISIASLTIAIFITFKLREPPQLITPENLPTLKTIVETTVKFLKSHLGLLRVLLNVVVVAACVSYIYEFWQLYLEAFAFPVAFFGLVSACLSVAVIPASLASGWLLKRFGHKQIVLFASFVCGGGILFAATVQNILGIAGLMLACASNAVISPVAFGYLHRFADDNARATIESSVSLGERVISIVLGLVFGYISNIYNVNSGFYFIGGLIILTSVFLTFSYKNK
ncbi:MAG TPA: hypothetical protein DD733_10000 [Clostridiales bacterium]|nr:hypothetical protein [Clostridiales bacterium]